MRIAIILFLLLCLLFSLFFALNIDKALDFLRAQFVEETSLLRASTVGEDSKTCYIASDNLLAAMIFRIYEDPLFYKIQKALDKYGGGADDLHEVLLGIITSDLFYERYNEFVDSIFGRFGNRVTPGKIVYELPNKSKPLTSWDAFADLIVYKSLKYFYSNNLDKAVENFEKLMKLWDGNGFRDSSYILNNLYETYKLALAVYLYELLSSKLKNFKNYEPAIFKMRKIIDSLQDLNGGMATNYKYDASSKKYIPMGDVNTETTCITLLAYSKSIIVKREIEKIDDLSKVTSKSSKCITIAFKAPKLEDINIITNRGSRRIKKFSNKVNSIICWLGPHESVKSIKINLELSKGKEDLSEKDLKVYIISLEHRGDQK